MTRRGLNDTRLRSLALVCNQPTPFQALRERFGRLHGVAVSLLGLAFKPNTDDVREGPLADLIRLITEEGVVVSRYDSKAVPAGKVVPDAVHLVGDLPTCPWGPQAVELMTEWPELGKSIGPL